MAFQTMYQLDARLGEPAEGVLAGILSDDEAGPELRAAERKRALDLAQQAFDQRSAADAFMLEIAPEWPPHRQASVDRAILRLAHYEMVSGISPPKVVINEAVELAKLFSTDRSPAFVNGLLDKLFKRLPAAAQPGQPATEPSAQDPG
jgi:transcription antitermination protein NusB